MLGADDDVSGVEGAMTTKLYDVGEETARGEEAALAAITSLAGAILALRVVGRHDDADDLTRARHEVFRVVCRVYGDGR